MEGAPQRGENGASLRSKRQFKQIRVRSRESVKFSGYTPAAAATSRQPSTIIAIAT